MCMCTNDACCVPRSGDNVIFIKLQTLHTALKRDNRYHVSIVPTFHYTVKKTSCTV